MPVPAPSEDRTRRLELVRLKRALDRARRLGDQLAAELAEAALNHTLEQRRGTDDNRHRTV